jgi:bifunctional enzyme CysN/CysC
MAVAASRADIAIVLIDATKGVRTQTLRHLMICNLMGVSRVIVAINKLDVLNYSQEVFSAIKEDLLSHISRFNLPDMHFIPMSALAGDNVVSHSTKMPWFAGQSLLECIQSWQPKKSEEITMRARVQSIVRAEDFRGVSTTFHRGKVRVGDHVRIHPSNQVATISTIIADMKKVEKAYEGDAVTLVFQPEVDITRGDLIASASEEISGSDRFSAHLVWLNEEALIHSRSYLLISGPTQIPVIVTKIRHSIDVNTGEEKPANTLIINEIGVVEIATNAPLDLLPYTESREFGNFILVDRITSESVGAGMIRHALRRGENITYQAYELDKSARESAKNQKAKLIWLTGLSGSGKSTIANALEKRLHALGMHVYVLDGDNLRMGLNVDLGFTAEDRAENVRRVAEVGKLMLDAGLIVITALVSPFEVDRQRARSIFNEGDFIEVFVDTPVDVCIARDPKGLYKKAAQGKIPNFTGVGQDYEKPSSPELIINGEVNTHISTEQILKLIL